MNKAEVLFDLRQKAGCTELIEKEMLKAPDFAPGVAVGIVAELLGNARIDWLLELFKLHPEHLIFWCKSEAQLSPIALKQRGLRLERFKFVNAKSDLQQSLRLALDSKSYPFIVAPNDFSEVGIFQKLHLLAGKSNSTIFLLGDKQPTQAWPISLQLEVNNGDNGKFSIEVFRQKHGVQL